MQCPADFRRVNIDIKDGLLLPPLSSYSRLSHVIQTGMCRSGPDGWSALSPTVLLPVDKTTGQSLAATRQTGSCLEDCAQSQRIVIYLKSFISQKDYQKDLFCCKFVAWASCC